MGLPSARPHNALGRLQISKTNSGHPRILDLEMHAISTYCNCQRLGFRCGVIALKNIEICSLSAARWLSIQLETVFTFVTGWWAMSTTFPVPTILPSLTAVDILCAHCRGKITNTSTSQLSDSTNVLNLERTHGVACIYDIWNHMAIYIYIHVYILIYVYRYMCILSTSRTYRGPLLKSSCFPSCGIIGCPWNLDSMRGFNLPNSNKNMLSKLQPSDVFKKLSSWE